MAWARSTQTEVAEYADPWDRRERGYFSYECKFI